MQYMSHFESVRHLFSLARPMLRGTILSRTFLFFTFFNSANRKHLNDIKNDHFGRVL